MKFQPGDRVVYIGKVQPSKRDKRATVTKRVLNDRGIYVLFDGEEEADGFYYDRRFISEELYDSPLFQALR